MKILKSETFMDPRNLTKFINQQGITREDILAILPESANQVGFTIFFYHDENIELPKKGFFD